MRRLEGITDSMAMGLSKLREVVRDSEAWTVYCGPWGHKESNTS